MRMQASNNIANGLVAELEQTNAKMAEVVLRIDTITYQENPQIEAEYASKIGILEMTLFRAQIQARRAKRKLQMANSLLNRSELNRSGDQVDAALEERLDQEFSAWTAQMEQAMQSMLDKASWLHGRTALSKTEHARLKKAYRLLMKRLHPDMRAEGSKLLDGFLEAARHAYTNGDAFALEALVCATENLQSPDYTKLSPIELEAQLAVADGMLADLKNQLNELVHSHPYTLKHKLMSRTWVSKQTRKLNGQIEEQQAVTSLYQARYEKLIAEECGAPSQSAHQNESLDDNQEGASNEQSR